jgi:hypothetical protein
LFYYLFAQNAEFVVTRTLILFASIFLLVGCFSASAQAPDDESYPPPARVISKVERSRLDAEADVKRRTKVALELMEARMKRAEELHGAPDFDAMFVELGAFHALVDDTLAFLTRAAGNDNDKVLNNLKRFEIGVRGFVPRLEVIRRDLPFRYEFYVRRLAIFLRDARAKAIEPLFSDTVVPPKKP